MPARGTAEAVEGLALCLCCRTILPQCSRFRQLLPHDSNNGLTSYTLTTPLYCADVCAVPEGKVVASVYISQNAPQGHSKQLIKCCFSAISCRTYRPVVIVGDFNVHASKRITDGSSPSSQRNSAFAVTQMQASVYVVRNSPCIDLTLSGTSRVLPSVVLTIQIRQRAVIGFLIITKIITIPFLRISYSLRNQEFRLATMLRGV